MTMRPPAEKRNQHAANRAAAGKQSRPQHNKGNIKAKAGRQFDEFFDEQAAAAVQSRKPSNQSKRAVNGKAAAGSEAANSKTTAKSAKSLAKPRKAAVARSKAKSKRSKGKRKRGPLARIVQLIIVSSCLVLSWCLFAYYMIVFNEQKTLVKADAGIVLGAAMWNNQPSPALKERLDYAIQLYEDGYVDSLILSGGKPEQSRGLTEAEGMKNYLLNAGIPEDRLLLESHSRDTYENLSFSKRVADLHGIHSVMIITHHYHTKRAEDIASFVDFGHVQTAGFETEVLNEGYHYTREMLAYTKWQLNKLLIPLGITL